MQTKLEVVLQSKGSEVHSVSPTTSVVDAIRTMNRERLGALLVKDNDSVVGIFSERDVLCRVVDQGLDPIKTEVGNVMTRELVTVAPETTVEEAMTVVTEKRCRHLPVMSGEQLKGLISIGDLTRWVTRKQEVHIQHLVKYITGKYPA